MPKLSLAFAVTLLGCVNHVSVVTDVAQMPDGSLVVERCDISTQPLALGYLSKDECRRTPVTRPASAPSP